MPQVSVIISAYNRPNLLVEAIESVLRQSYTDWDLHIACDGAPSSVRQIVEEYAAQDARIHGYFLPHSGKVAKVRNHAIRQAAGEYVAFLDDDDVWFPHKLQVQMALLESQPELRMISASMVPQTPDGAALPDMHKPPIPTKHTARTLSRTCYFPLCMALVRRSDVLEAGGFCEDLDYAEDYDLWLRLMHKGPFTVLEKPLGLYRIHGNNLSQYNKAKGPEESYRLIRVYKDHLRVMARARLNCKRLGELEALNSQTAQKYLGLANTHLDVDMWAPACRALAKGILFDPFLGLKMPTNKNLSRFQKAISPYRMLLSHALGILKGKAPKSERPVQIAYFLDVFPALSDAFIINEFLGIERLGIGIEINSYRDYEEELHSPELVHLKGPVQYFGTREYSKREKAASLFWALRSNPPFFFSEFIRVFQGTRSLRWHFLQAVCKAKTMAMKPPTHVHAHFDQFGAYYAWVCARLLRVPFTSTNHGGDAWTESYPQVSRDADALVTVSESHKAFLIDQYALEPAKVHVIPCGIDAAKFFQHQRQLPSTPVILTVGRLHSVKNQAVLLDACRILRAQGLEFRCFLIGEGPEKDALSEQIRALDLSDTVELLGSKTQEDIARLLSQSTVFALPSQTETLGVALIEAMASGVPAVASRAGALPEIIEEHVNGYLVEPGNAEQLAGALKKLLEDRELNQIMGNNARRAVAGKLDSQTSANKLARLWASFAASRDVWPQIPDAEDATPSATVKRKKAMS
ncbi:MAG: glycosyltransferase [Candidatus Omnitrophica bacterium]|nr:glycosyltransferase [Candidatus Omnitrophota bacterium]